MAAIGDAVSVKEMDEAVSRLSSSPRIEELKRSMLAEERFVSVEQARIVTESYAAHSDSPRILKRAYALADALRRITVRVDPGELIVGNRTPGVRAGVVFPESGISWIAEELDTLPGRPQDPFLVTPEAARTFREEILPHWPRGTLEDEVADRLGGEIDAVRSVVKINQTDHAQGHICPDVATWLAAGPRGLLERARHGAENAPPRDDPGRPAGRDFYRAVAIALDGAVVFIARYAEQARRTAAAEEDPAVAAELGEVARVCAALAERPPESFHEALQAVWFLFVTLQMESNASSFSPGRLDQYLLPFLMRDLEEGVLDLPRSQELIEALWLKFNQIVYMRSRSSAQYFAGFPIGFNVAIGGMDRNGRDATNLLSFMILRAQEHIGLPQPNLSARLWKGSPAEFVDRCARVIGLGSGMPQIVNDESVIPALMWRGIDRGDARDYAVVGCVELSTQGNNLGWSDAAMFNLVKVLELALNDGVCMLTGRRLGPATGSLVDFSDFAALERAYRRQFDFFFDSMIPLCDAVDRLHAEILPSPFLSSVIDGCMESGVDVTAGGARYNLSGIQAIQVANLADSLAALKEMVFDRREVAPDELLQALRSDYAGAEALRVRLIETVPKYGNDVAWVDELGSRWTRYFATRLGEFTNARGGPYHMGLYTVSAHVPMGKNVAATPDGRLGREPLADGGLSAMYGRDRAGPTALLASVARIDASEASNGTLLNMKFLPRTFLDAGERGKFTALLSALVRLNIHHVQFNVVDRATLLAAQGDPDAYRNLTIRVAGYTAYFVELAPDLQEEIIARTAYGEVL
ncbi:MAG: formate C-acetyltransferase/glycerol dehydratase family glycyl radical enzyme [Spirochaetales bacterium]|nr:formate C-acetyltransferase/glycerol dehydratase family glycyl radical enzyme [Spirochaetales bacterium]